jgi:rod shape-determining protein MreC
MRSRVILFAVLIVVAFQVVIFVAHIPQAEEVKSLRVVALPFYRGGLIVYRFFHARLALLREKEALLAENRRLREELGKMQGENVLLRESLEQLKMEVEAAKIERYFSFEVIPAQVIGRDPYNWLGVVVIDRGREEGVSEGLAVVTYQGMVGRVEKAYPHYAEVRLLLSPSLALGVLIQRTRDLGVLMGDGQGLCVVQYISRLSQVQEGDVVITSGLGGKIPRGVVVGRVREVKEGDGDLFKEVVVEPACDFSLLGRVFVIQ